jgi:hypothetical protein
MDRRHGRGRACAHIRGGLTLIGRRAVIGAAIILPLFAGAASAYQLEPGKWCNQSNPFAFSPELLESGDSWHNQFFDAALHVWNSASNVEHVPATTPGYATIEMWSGPASDFTQYGSGVLAVTYNMYTNNGCILNPGRVGQYGYVEIEYNDGYQHSWE